MNKLISQLSSAATSNTSTTAAAAAAINPTPSVDFTAILQSTLLQSLSSVLANAALPVTSQTAVSNSIKSDVTDKSQSETIPEYRPTPIAELERRKRLQQQQQQLAAMPNTKTSKTFRISIRMISFVFRFQF